MRAIPHPVAGQRKRVTKRVLFGCKWDLAGRRGPCI